LKIAIITPHFNDLVYGTSSQIRDLSLNLIKNFDYDIRLIVEPLEQRSLSAPLSRLRFNYTNTSLSFDSLYYIKKLPKTFFETIKIIKKERFDLVYIRNSLSYLILSNMIRKMANVPVVHCVDVSWAFTNIYDLARIILNRRNPYTPNLLDNKTRFLILKHLFKSNTVLLASSIHIKNLLCNFLSKTPDKVQVIYPGINVPKITNKETSSEKSVITYYGSISKWRGALDVLRAFKKVSAINSNVELVLSAPRITEAQRVIFEKRIHDVVSPNVHILGYAKNVNDELLRPSSIICLPFHLVGVDPPLTILEAMAASKPVISTNVSGISEILTNEKTGLLIKPGDVTSLASAMKRLLDFPELGKTLGQNARSHVTNICNWTKITREHDQVFKNAIDTF